MRSSKSRSRNKPNRQRSLGNIVNRVFDSSGPESKVRGTPQQIIDKYLMLARDAQLSNDRVAEQAFLQHAEHYTRMLGEAQREMAREQEARQSQGGGNGNGNGGGHYQGGERDGGGNRERYENRQQQRTEEADAQPDFAPLGAVERDDDGPGLVETPEMYHAPQPAAFEGHMPDFLTGATEAEAPVASEARPRRNDRRPDRGGERSGERGGDKGAAERAPKADRPERGPRGPRRPKAERAPAEPVGEAATPPETSDGE